MSDAKKKMDAQAKEAARFLLDNVVSDAKSEPKLGLIQMQFAGREYVLKDCYDFLRSEFANLKAENAELDGKLKAMAVESYGPGMELFKLKSEQRKFIEATKKLMDEACSKAVGSLNQTPKSEPLIGYVVIEDYEEGMGHWDGSIAYPNPEGANLYWQKPEPFIQKSAFDALQSELETVKRERDLAINHDRQPYPTAFAYEQACKVIKSLRTQLADVELKKSQLADIANKTIDELTIERQANKILRDALEKISTHNGVCRVDENGGPNRYDLHFDRNSRIEWAREALERTK